MLRATVSQFLFASSKTHLIRVWWKSVHSTRLMVSGALKELVVGKDAIMCIRLSGDGSKTFLVNLNSDDLKPEGWDKALNCIGINVVLGVVYNHLHASGPHDKESVLDKIVSGYYLRRNNDGFVENSTCVNNTASEHYMVEKGNTWSRVCFEKKKLMKKMLHVHTDQVNNPNEQDIALGLGTGPSTARATAT